MIIFPFSHDFPCFARRQRCEAHTGKAGSVPNCPNKPEARTGRAGSVPNRPNKPEARTGRAENAPVPKQANI